MLLMTAGAIFGARSLAPEREQQTLPQLLTTPLLPREIIMGKFLAVGVWTFYVWITAIPIALLLTLFGMVSPLTLLAFLLLELVYGACAAAWGLFCSMRALTVRRALGWALGGVAALVITNSVLQNFWYDASARGGSWGTSYNIATNAVPNFNWQNLSTMFLPSTSMRSAIGASEGFIPSWYGVLATGSLVVFLIAALFFLWRTAADFKSYLQEI
jgi:ABC-type transport system involved in multi-copper enzyme maturation permease subunit